MRRRRILLMRHGAVDYFRPDGRPVPAEGVPLNDQGRLQADAAGQLFRQQGLRFDLVVTSGLPRTVETARRVLAGAAQERELLAVPALREIRGGRLADIPPDQFDAAFTGAFAGGADVECRRFLGGESIGDMLDRVLPAFDELLRRRDWNCMLLVLHGAVNRAILSRALTGGRAFLGAFEQSPACINIIDVGDDNLVVRATNLAPTAWLHEGDRRTTMETLLAQYRRQREAAPRQPWTLPALLRSEHEAQAIQGLQLLIVAHSGGCMMVAHWAHATQRPVQGVLPATPPDFDKPMPRGYPTLAQFDTRGWLPAPCRRLRFRSVTVASRHDPPGAFSRVDTLAADRDRRLVELLEVAPLNHASGFGTWTRTFDFIAELAAAPR